IARRSGECNYEERRRYAAGQTTKGDRLSHCQFPPPKRPPCRGGGGGAPVVGRGFSPMPSIDLLYAGTSLSMTFLYSPFTFSSVFSSSSTRPICVSVAPQSPEPCTSPAPVPISPFNHRKFWYKLYAVWKYLSSLSASARVMS